MPTLAGEPVSRTVKSGSEGDESFDQPDLRRILLDAYRTTQGEQASGGLYRDISAAWPYYEANYRDLLEPLARTARILDVGTGHGSVLAWLRTIGFSDVHGVDTSPDDVAFANEHLGAAAVVLQDGRDYLRTRPGEYDLVIAKAMLEHIPRDELLPMTDAMAGALAPGGRLIIDVPNMDWILSGHERYMDLTHEGGFTRESLAVLLSLSFERVSVRGSRLAAPSRRLRIANRASVALFRLLLRGLAEGGSDLLFASRSIIAVGSQPRAKQDRSDS
jgi:2-polyprenyl-3-methyl-5-hydroxy-6-metoxy-1,4-benzoquinol methylase